MKKFIEKILVSIIVTSIPIIGFLYWLAFGYGNHLENIITLFTYTF